MGLIQEFKDFIAKGNVLDLAVGVVIGGAFGKIVTSVVDNILMPPLGYATGGVDFKDLKTVLQAEVKDAAGKVTTPEVAIGYGVFIQTVIQFLIVAFFVFLVVKAYNNMKKAEEPAPAGPSAQEVLLAEIRDGIKSLNR